MAIQESGPISLLDIQDEFGGSAPISLSEYYGAASGIPSSGQIRIGDFYGASSGSPYDIDLTTSTSLVQRDIPYFEPDYYNAQWGLAFNNDGSKFYVAERRNDLRDFSAINEYNVGGGRYKIDNLSFNASFDLAGVWGNITWSPDGSRLIVADIGRTTFERRFKQYYTSTPFSVSGLSYQGATDYVGDIPGGVGFTPDGSSAFLYWWRTSNNTTSLLSRSTPHSILGSTNWSSASYTTLPDMAETPFFSPDGMVCYGLDSGNNNFYKNYLSTPFDPFTAVSSGQSFDVSGLPNPIGTVVTPSTATEPKRIIFSTYTEGFYQYTFSNG